ncbi:MAG: ABC transporter permease [Erysipelotrichaceae bacterium]|nr:ABC transporter permease [Erysipelotrichaceae bacterium]
MFHKDTLRLIKSTFNRFLSLLLIVLIGVAFMMGLLSTRRIMEYNVDRYADEEVLQDIQLFSSYGFDDKDVRALQKLDYVESVFPSRLVDCYSESKYGITVARAEEIDRTVNLFELSEGRMPENAKEILILDNGSMSTSYAIGEKLRLYLEDEDIGEKLKNTEFTIVGKVRTPAYMAKTLGTGTMKNLDLSIVIYLPNENFISEYYTTVYLTFAGAKGYESFEQEYRDFIDEQKAELEVFTKDQQEVLKTSILKEYEDKIADGEKELAEKKEEAEAELAKAKEDLDNANVQIIAGETQLTTMQSAVQQAQEQQKELSKRYSENGQPVYQRIAEIESRDSAHRSFDTIYTELLADYGSYRTLTTMSSPDSQAAFDQRISELQTEISDLNGQIAALESEKSELQAKIDDPETGDAERAAAESRILAIDPEIDALRSRVNVDQQVLDSLNDARTLSASEAKAAKEALDKKYSGSIEKTYSEYSRLQRDKLIYDALKQEMELADEAVTRLNQEIASAQWTLQDARRQYEDGKKKYEEGLLEYQEEVEKAEAEIRKAKQDLEELPAAEWMLLDRDSHYSTLMFSANAKQMGAIGIALPFLFYLVAALVCMTTMTRLVDEQRGQIGIFRALGFSKGKIIMKYVLYALLATLIGSVLGIGLGMALFPTVIYETWRLMYMLPPREMLFPVQNIAICFVLFAGLMSFVTYLVVNGTLKEMPSQLMRPKAPKSSKKVFLEYIPFLWRRLSFTSKITARNLIRYKARFIMTVVGIAGCTALLVVGWGIKDSIADVVDLQFGSIFNYDYVVNLEDDRNLTRIVDELKKDLDNEYVVPYAAYSSKVYLPGEEKTINVEVLDAREAQDVLNLRLAADHKTPLKMKNSGVIISQKFAQNQGLEAGDKITIESANGIKREVRITEVCEMYFQHYLYISEEYYATLFDEPLHYTNIAVKNATGGNFDSVRKIEGFESVVDFSNMVTQFTTMIEALDIIILVIILTAGSLAFVVLMNLTQVNISERIREIATLKVLGFRDYEVNSYIFKEIFLLTLIGAAFGLPLGVVEHHFIMGVINMEMIMFGSNIKFLSFLYAFLVTIVFTVIVLFFTRKPLKKIDMIESLKSVE